MNILYTTDGNNGNDGSSDETANALAYISIRRKSQHVAGDKVWIKAGNYGSVAQLYFCL